MSRASLRRCGILAALLLFVAWFGVWEIYRLMAPAVGGLWAGVMAAAGALGLAVIAFVGVIMIRTRETMDRAGAPGVDEGPPNTQK